MSFYCDGLVLRDEHGRERIFKGINLCFKVSTKKLLSNSLPSKLLPILKENGVNIVRLGVNWSYIEPRDNELNEAVIDGIRNWVEQLGKEGIYVVLDMHQDLFFCNGGVGDGAPKWVLDSSIKEKKPMFIWAEGYFYMRGVQQAFNDFWQNKNGVQDKFIRMWRRVAEAVEEYDNVIAYDYLNEPQVVDNANRLFCLMMNNICRNALGFELNADECYKNGRERLGFLKMSWRIAKNVKTTARLKYLFEYMDNYEHMGEAVSGFGDITKDFDSEYYQPFFDRMDSEINKGNMLSLFEHNYYANLGVPFGIKANERSVYSPHAYDFFIDSQLYNNYSSNERIRYIIDGIRANQERMNVPVIMGEFGGGANNGSKWIEHIDYVFTQIEKHHWSNIYWAYRFKNKDFMEMANRPYPVAVCGDIIEYRVDSSTRSFYLKYNCDREYPVDTEIYIPKGEIKHYKAQAGVNEIEFTY